MINYNAGSAGHYHVGVEQGDTAQLRRIIERVLPSVMDRFALKNRQYGENEFELGAAGQFPEIWRKVKRLRALIWDGPRGGFDAFEDADEVIDDLVGHLLMLKDCLSTGLVENLERPEDPRGPAVTRRPDGTVALSGPGDQVVGHLIREAKDGPETWTDGHESGDTHPADLLAQREPLNRKGVAVDGHSIRVATTGEERCPWRFHGGKDDGMRNQCVGLAGHERAVVDRRREDFHINADMEAWPA